MSGINKKQNKNKGFATVELLIAFTILVLNISAVILLINGGQSIYIDSETNTEAITKARAMLEQARADSEFDFALVNSCDDDPATPAPPCSAADPFYNRKLDVEQLDFFTKEVTSTISWLAEGGRTLSIVLKTLLTNPDAVAGGNTCNSALSGDWTNPRIMTYKYKPNGTFEGICENGEFAGGQNCDDGYEFGEDILGDTSSGFPISSIQNFNHKMYVTVNNTKGNNDETFFILDLSDTPNLRPSHVLGKLDNSPSGESDISEGLNAVAFDGKDYAYVANAYDSSPASCSEGDNCAQLQVIKTNCVDNDSDGIDDVCSPERIRDFKIDSVATSGNLAHGTSILYKNEIIYLGLAKSTGSEFYILDVSTPGSPDIIDSEEIGAGVNSILVKNNYAYIASPFADEVQTFSVSNAGSLTPVGGFNAPTGGGHGKSMYAVGNLFYLGKTIPNAGPEFYILDNSDPEADDLPTVGPGLELGVSINGLIIRQFLAFFVTNDEFQTWRISDPLNVAQYANPLTLPPGSGNVKGSASDCEGNYIYIGSQKEAEESVPECSDGIDNDGDNKIDYPDDNQCADPDDSESGGGSPQSQDKGYISIITGGEEDE